MTLKLLRLFQRLIVALCLAGVIPLATAAAWSISVDSAQGLPIIKKGGATAVSSYFAFWRANWGWADTTTTLKIVSPLSYTVTGRNALLNFDVTETAAKTSETQMNWDFNLNAATATSNIIGGGISFQFDLTSFGAEMGTPEILPGNVGWAWGKPGGNRVEMRFSPALPYIYFTNAAKTELRAYFYNTAIPAGQTRHTATLTLAGDMAFVPTLAERFGPTDTTTWPTGIVDWRVSPVDLSFMNQPEIPAGKRGFVKAQGDRLVFGDGTPARFWGTNLSAYTLFATSKSAVQQQARRLSELGFNMVRIHHHDSSWVDPNVFGPGTLTDTRTLSATSLDKLDWWIKCLKDQGIYVWLDLHVLRFVKTGDNIQYFSEISKGKSSGDLRGFNYVNSTLVQAMKNFNQAYVNHLNPYTGLRYKDEPAIAGMLVTNENDLTHHFGNSLLPDKNVPNHNAIYTNLANQFATTWGLPKDKVWRSWEPGPSKIFLNDLERRFNVDMIAHLRSLGVKVPIATTQYWGTEPLSSLPALTSGYVMDNHTYGAMGEIEKNPLYAPNLVNWIAASQVVARPLTVTEWNVEKFPVPDRHSSSLYVAANAVHQGWDAILQFAYSQVALDYAGGASNWHAYNDPSMLATLPAAAVLYRQGHVQEASTVYAFAPSASLLFNQYTSPANSPALRTAAERGKLVIAMPAVRELPWLQASPIPAGATVITDPNQSLLPANATGATSDSGQLRRDWEQGVYTINTPRTQAALGWIGGQTIKLPDVDVAVTTGNASVAVQSLDGNAIGASRRLLISLGARSVTAGGGSALPFYSEPVVGRLTIRAPSGLKLYKRTTGTTTEVTLPFTYVDGAYVINLDQSFKTYWLTLK